MPATINNTIMLNCVGPIRYKEGIAASGSSLKPGYLIRESAAPVLPNPPTVNVHNVIGEKCLVQIVIEDALQGKSIDDTYTAGEPVRSILPRSGDRIQVMLKAGQNAVYGSHLASNGDGRFRVITPSTTTTTTSNPSDTRTSLLLAREALDLTSGSDTLITAEVL